jgi:hypothetical protein
VQYSLAYISGTGSFQHPAVMLDNDEFPGQKDTQLQSADMDHMQLVHLVLNMCIESAHDLVLTLCSRRNKTAYEAGSVLAVKGCS